MGCQQSTLESDDAKKKSKMLENEIDRQAKQEAEKIKLLLLGKKSFI